jgi:hypothetical protein
MNHLSPRGQWLPARAYARRFASAHRELQLDLVWNHAVLCSRVDSPDNDDNRVERIVLSGDDGLQGKNGAGGNHHGINCAQRTATVAAHSKDGNVHGIGCGQRIPRSVAHLSDRLVGAVIQP